MDGVQNFPFCEVDPKPGDMPGMKAILLNGPPGAGKDTAGKILKQHWPRMSPPLEVGKFSRRLKESVHADFGYPSLPHDYFEDCKDRPLALFNGMSPREAYIFKSETMVKPNLGAEFYGRIFLRDMWMEYRRGVRTVAITDSGFISEVAPLADVIGPENILLIHIRAEMRGKTFAGDSRSYLQLQNVETLDISNNATIERFAVILCAEVGRWVHPPVFGHHA
jgi:hypothetical protein